MPTNDALELLRQAKIRNNELGIKTPEIDAAIQEIKWLRESLRDAAQDIEFLERENEELDHAND